MNKEEKLWLDRISRIGCIVCRNLDYPADGQEVAIHHLRAGMGVGMRAKDLDSIPLCPLHHQLGGYGVAIHAGQKYWEELYGTELELLSQVQSIVKDKVEKGELYSNEREGSFEA